MNESEPDWDALIRECFEHPRAQAPLNRFFQAILPYVHAALTSRYSSDPSVVDDAIQAASLKYRTIFQRKPRWPLHVGYFIVVARNCLIDELRRRKGHLSIDEIAADDLPTVPAATPEERDERMMLVQHAMLQLDSRCQFILERYYIDEVDSREIAGWLNIGPESVHMAIKRCRDRLKQTLADLMARFSEAPITKP